MATVFLFDCMKMSSVKDISSAQNRRNRGSLGSRNYIAWSRKWMIEKYAESLRPCLTMESIRIFSKTLKKSDYGKKDYLES